jgi:ABC-2 type transport system ATP-binding protein
VSKGEGRFLLELSAHANDQDVLAAALSHGPVIGFTRRKPRLSELYREAVSS